MGLSQLPLVLPGGSNPLHHFHQPAFVVYCSPTPGGGDVVLDGLRELVLPTFLQKGLSRVARSFRIAAVLPVPEV